MPAILTSCSPPRLTQSSLTVCKSVINFSAPGAEYLGSIPKNQTQPMMLRNHYGVDMGTGGLVLQAQSHEEFFAGQIAKNSPTDVC